MNRTPLRRFRMNDDLWTRFDAAVQQMTKPANKSTVIRGFIRWYVGETDELPQRPSRQSAV